MSSSASRGLQLALYYLEKRGRTEKELREKLARKEVPPQEIEAVMAKLKELGYVDDVKFVANFQRSRNEYKPMGVRRLKQELYIKGAPKELIETVTAEKEVEQELAFQAAQTRLRQYSNLEPEVFKRRMTGFLARRGFNYGTIKQVLERL
jgi:regulatory protein